MNFTLPNGYILKNSCKPLHGFKYNHHFDGHGLINRIEIKDNSFTYKGIRVRTEHYNYEKRTNKMLFRGLNTNVKNNRLFIGNFSNISVFHHQKEVQSLSEGGIPYIIDVENCKSNGRKFKWVPPLVPYFPISVHPKIDNDKVVNFSCLLNGFILFDGDGVILTEFFKHDNSYYFHDFSITEHYYVFYLNNINVDVKKLYDGKGTILDSFQFNKGNKILVIHKITLCRTYFELPEYYDHNSLHIAHAKNKTASTIDMYLSFVPHNFRISDIKTPYDFDGCFLHRIQLNVDTNNINAYKISGISGEMPIVADDKIFMINANTLSRYDIKTERLSTKFFKGQVIEEPIIAEKKIFVIGHIENKTIITVLDIDTMECIHIETFPFKIPYGFHGTFVPIS